MNIKIIDTLLDHLEIVYRPHVVRGRHLNRSYCKFHAEYAHVKGRYSNISFAV